jgi:hypothetical protein
MVMLYFGISVVVALLILLLIRVPSFHDFEFRWWGMSLKLRTRNSEKGDGSADKPADLQADSKPARDAGPGC